MCAKSAAKYSAGNVTGMARTLSPGLAAPDAGQLIMPSAQTGRT